MTLMRSGVLLCGGNSTRFGAVDKSTATLAGKPLVRHVADRLVDLLAELVVSCREDQYDAIATALDGYPKPVEFAYDEAVDAGPLHGIKRGLTATNATDTLVVASDMPFVDPGFVRYLFSRVEGHDVALARTPDGWYQPLQAVYSVPATLAAIEEAEREGIERPIDVVETVEYVVIEGETLASVADERTFFNVNTREDLTAARDLIDRSAVGE
jgi:molybdopterin-guanine dinucleotide biosynthesis protein A